MTRSILLAAILALPLAAAGDVWKSEVLDTWESEVLDTWKDEWHWGAEGSAPKSPPSTYGDAVLVTPHSEDEFGKRFHVVPMDPAKGASIVVCSKPSEGSNTSICRTLLD